MKNKVFIRVFAIIALLAFLTVSVISILPTDVNAISVSEAQKQKEEAKKKGDEAKAAKQKEMEKVAEIDAQIAVVQKEIDECERQITEKVAKIEESTKQIEALGIDLTNQNAAYTERATSLIKKGNVSYMEVVLKSKSMDDLLTRVSVLKHVAKYDTKKLKEIENSLKIVEELKAKLVTEKEAVLKLKEEQNAKNATLQSYRDESEQIISGLQKTIEDAEAQYAAADKAEKEAREAAEKAAKSGKYEIPPNFVGGQFMWPSNTTIVTSPYGYRIHPVTKRQRFHSGVDIGASYGTNIYAANSGTVVVAGYNTGGYGNYVVINHGGGYSTLYAHCSALKVSSGQHVERGQVIALCGSTGMSTGPHIHFEIQLNGKTTNPMSYF
ncbi:MAG: M23 family metallopeptidase [Clostridia bacterium]|nr:M23 family metallopeptidase [Clostridia bacterium]